MANYSYVVDSKFNPMTVEQLQSLMTPIATEHKQLMAGLAEKAAQASIWERLANDEVDSDSYQRYKDYVNQLQNVKDRLNTEGLGTPGVGGSGIYNDIYDLSVTYAQDIAPLQIGYDRKMEMVKEEEAAKRQNPYLRVETPASSISISSIIANPHMGNKYLDINKAYSMASDAYEQMAQSVRNNPTLMKTLIQGADTDLLEIYQKQGWTAAEILEVLRRRANNGDEQAAALIENVKQNVREASGINTWQVNNYTKQVSDEVDAAIENAAWHMVGSIPYNLTQTPSRTGKGGSGSDDSEYSNVHFDNLPVGAISDNSKIVYDDNNLPYETEDGITTPYIQDLYKQRDELNKTHSENLRSHANDESSKTNTKDRATAGFQMANRQVQGTIVRVAATQLQAQEQAIKSLEQKIKEDKFASQEEKDKAIQELETRKQKFEENVQKTKPEIRNEYETYKKHLNEINNKIQKAQDAIQSINTDYGYITDNNTRNSALLTNALHKRLSYQKSNLTIFDVGTNNETARQEVLTLLNNASTVGGSNSYVYEIDEKTGKLKEQGINPKDIAGTFDIEDSDTFKNKFKNFGIDADYGFVIKYNDKLYAITGPSDDVKDVVKATLNVNKTLQDFSNPDKDLKSEETSKILDTNSFFINPMTGKIQVDVRRMFNENMDTITKHAQSLGNNLYCLTFKVPLPEEYQIPLTNDPNGPKLTYDIQKVIFNNIGRDENGNLTANIPMYCSSLLNELMSGPQVSNIREESLKQWNTTQLIQRYTSNTNMSLTTGVGINKAKYIIPQTN